MAQEQHGTYPQNRSPGRSCSLFAPPLTRVRATGLARGQDPVAIEENALVHTKRRPLLLPLCIEITFRRITRQPGRAGSRRLGQLLRAGKGTGRKADGRARGGLIRRRSCRRADGAPARGGRSHEKVGAGETRLFAPGRRKSGWAEERPAAAPGVSFEASCTPFRNNSGDISCTTGRLSTEKAAGSGLSPLAIRRQEGRAHRLVKHPSSSPDKGKRGYPQKGATLTTTTISL